MACSRALMLIYITAVSMAALLSGTTIAAVSCDEVASELSPCLSYLGDGGSPSTSCCGGVKNLYSNVPTTADKQAVCNCIKQEISSIHYNSTNLQLASGLPAKCDVDIPYQISPSIDCNTIK